MHPYFSSRLSPTLYNQSQRGYSETPYRKLVSHSTWVRASAITGLKHCSSLLDAEKSTIPSSSFNIIPILMPHPTWTKASTFTFIFPLGGGLHLFFLTSLLVDTFPSYVDIQLEPTLTHALLTCEEVRRWWFACPLAIRVEENEEIDILQWIGGSINFGVDEVTTRVFEKLYTIWRCINSLVFLF